MRVLRVTLLLLACWLTKISAEDCTKRYSVFENPPLLFGGVADASRCKAGCLSRNTFWGRQCSFNSGWGVCNAAQRKHSLAIGKTLGGGLAKKLTPCHVVRFLRGRTLWILGDSHAKSFYKAMQCFLIDFWNHRECETSPSAFAMKQLYNLPGAPGQSKCFHLLGDGGGRVCMVHNVLGTNLLNNPKVAKGGVLPLLRSKFARPQDIFYINFGIWHRKKPDWYKTYQPALQALGQYYQATRGQWPHMLFHELPAEHPKDLARGVCKPLQGYYYNQRTGGLSTSAAAGKNMQGWTSGYTLNTIARQTLSKYGVSMLSYFPASSGLYDNHVGKVLSPELDCLHYCHPGVPEMWIWYLYEAMHAGRSGIRPIESGGRSREVTRTPTFKCVPTSTMF